MKTTKLHIKLIFSVAIITAMISMALMVYPASAEATRVEFQNYNIACTITSQTLWVSDDGIVHIRDRVLNSVVTSNSNYFAGPGHIFANANISDPVNGIGTYFGTLDIYPTAYPEGHWFGHWSMQITENGYQGIARLKGYGDLEGMLSFSKLTPLPPTVLANFKGLCGGNQPVAGTYVEGYYLVPGSE
ncbi:MAG TPA: hypothetical protein VLA49_00460 [Anaerolineales bacterium]|nr:hypothetical protein [Anaerolineales bacterium]